VQQGGDRGSNQSSQGLLVDAVIEQLGGRSLGEREQAPGGSGGTHGVGDLAVGLTLGDEGGEQAAQLVIAGGDGGADG
jgi:hypothetical protein